MNRGMNHVVDAGLEQFDGVLEMLQAAQGDDGCARPVANAEREAGSVEAITQQKCADRAQVVADGAFQPVAEIRRREADRNDPFAVKAGCVAVYDALPVIDYNEHFIPLRRLNVIVESN